MDITEKGKEKEKIVYKADWDNLKITKNSIILLLRRSMQ
jgi:hypothetical protein